MLNATAWVIIYGESGKARASTSSLTAELREDIWLARKGKLHCSRGQLECMRTRAQGQELTGEEGRAPLSKGEAGEPRGKHGYGEGASYEWLEALVEALKGGKQREGERYRGGKGWQADCQRKKVKEKHGQSGGERVVARLTRTLGEQ